MLDNLVTNVQVFIVDRNISDECEKKYFHSLKSDERERAKRYRFSKDRKQYIASRYALRKILAEQVGFGVNEIDFNYTKYGKPYLANNAVYFNVSHSNQKALIAISPNPVGIDIEWHFPKIEIDELALRFFSRKEIEAFLQIDIAQKLQVFYSIWTKKEAVIKAIGDGLSFPLDSFNVGVQPTDDSLEFLSPSSRNQQWKLNILPLPFPDYSAALVASHNNLNRITIQEFQTS